MGTQYDCIIIGGGVSGLTAGAYLAKAGISTLILPNTPLPVKPDYRQSLADNPM